MKFIMRSGNSQRDLKLLNAGILNSNKSLRAYKSLRKELYPGLILSTFIFLYICDVLRWYKSCKRFVLPIRSEQKV